MIRVSDTELKGVKLITVDHFRDHRGIYVETFNAELYKAEGIDVEFVQDDYSRSVKNVLRGIHGDKVTWKLVSCPYGEIYLVVVNCDKSSENFGKWQSFIISENNFTQVLIPPKYGNAHLVLSGEAIFHYKQSTYYNPDIQFSYRWNDERFNIDWPVREPILSERDKRGEMV